MSEIFISYSREQTSQARMLAELLTSHGWDVWWDREIPAGEAWDRVIEEQLTKAQSVIVLWSQTSVNSDWVRNEAREGLQRKILIPALVEAVDMPLEFRGVQTISLIDWHGGRLHLGIQHLLHAIAADLGGARPGCRKDLGIDAEELKSASPSRSVESDVANDVVGIAFGSQPLGTGFLLGRSSLLVTDSNVYNGVVAHARGRPISAIMARPMRGGDYSEATLILPPDQGQDFALYDAGSRRGTGTIVLGSAPPTVGEDTICPIAVGDRQGLHRGKTTGIDQNHQIAGLPGGPGFIESLLVTDIVTSAGSSGAPVLRRNGELLGMIVAGDRNSQSFAVPASRLVQRLKGANLLQ